MLLRWLVNQYLRDAAEGKMREVVTDIVQSPRTGTRIQTPQASTNPGKLTSAAGASQAADAPEFLPCDAVILFALAIESGGLVDLLKGTETSRHAHGIERAGKLGRHEVAIVESGVGQQAAARATAEAIKFYQPKWVISAGFAGGLTENLRRGHIVMADDVASLSGDQLQVGLKVDPESLAGMKGLHFGRLLTVDSILRNPAERRQLADEYGAIAADMETFAVAKMCRELGVPFLGIRIISDAVDDELPPEIENLLAQKSLAAKLGAAAGAVLKRFSAAKDLWHLREDALKASDRLAKFLMGVVQQLTNDK